MSLDAEAGRIVFENGETASADLIVAADGIRVTIPISIPKYPVSHNMILT